MAAAAPLTIGLTPGPIGGTIDRTGGGQTRKKPIYLLMVGAAIAGTSSCAHDVQLTAPQPSETELVASVTGAAAEALDAGGRFILPPPEPTTAVQITAARAAVLAVAWSKQFGPYFREWLEGERGGRIAFNNVAPCGRALYAISPFLEPPLDMHPGVRNSVAPQWLITLCEGATPKLSIAVSVWATELTILDDGRIKWPTNGGGEFHAHGVPVGHLGEFPVSPERAAWSVASRTGLRVTNAPVLIAGPGRHAGYARWTWTMERPVRVRTVNGRAVVTDELFVSERLPGTPAEAVYVAADSQPESVELLSFPLLIPGESFESYQERKRTETRMIQVVRRPEVPVHLERAATVEAQR